MESDVLGPLCLTDTTDMIGTKLKERYWDALNAWRKWRHPDAVKLSPEAWMDAVARQMPTDAQKLIYVDGGAHDGQMARSFLRRFPHLHVHAFEPNQDLLPALHRNLAGVPGSIHQKALSDRTQTLEFIVNQSPMTSSVLPRSSLSEQYFDAATMPRETRQVQATTLDDWFQASHLPRVDILKLDLQGYELHALRGATRLLETGVGCIFAEVNFAPFYEGSAIFADLDLLLRQRGYRLYNLYNLCTHLPAGCLGGADAIWIPDETRSPSMRKAA